MSVKLSEYSEKDQQSAFNRYNIIKPYLEDNISKFIFMKFITFYLCSICVFYINFFLWKLTKTYILNHKILQ
jgi:hypothetical protein